MYQKFFQFREPPFNLTPDPRFFFYSKKHKEALEYVLYSVKQRKGFVVITGEVGTGKTTLCRLLLDRISKTEKISSALIFNPSLSTVELLQAINQDFSLGIRSSSKGELVNALNEFLLRELRQGGNALLIIDEAQNLSTECMEEIRMLSNLETDKEKLLQILLVGQPELREKLMLPELRQLNQRIALRYHIQPLDLEESRAYIGYRLKVAGGQDRILFTPKALERIYQVSNGIPRLINAACDKSLLAAYVSEVNVVNEDCVARAAAELPVFDQEKWVRPSRYRRAARKTQQPVFSKARVVTIGLLILLTLGVWRVQDWSRVFPISSVRQAIPNPANTIPAAPAPAQVVSPPPMGFTEEAIVAKEIEFVSPANEPQPVPAGFDSDGVYRVQDPAHTRLASILTLLNLWGIHPEEEIDIEKLAEERISRLLEAHGLRTYPLVPDLKRLRTFNYPCLLSGRWGQGPETTYLVLSELTDTEAVVLDPLRGRNSFSLETLQGLWEDQAGLVWKGVAGIVLPIQGRPSQTTVRTLQRALKSQGFYRGPVDGIMGPKTRRSIRLFQRQSGLGVDGIFGIESYLVLSKTMLEDSIPDLGAETL